LDSATLHVTLNYGEGFGLVCTYFEFSAADIWSWHV